MSHQTDSRRNFFYKRISVGATSSFPNKAQIEIPFTATHVIIFNSSVNNDIGFSFLRPDLDGELFQKEAPLALDGVAVSKIWFKKLLNTANPSVRVWAWRL